MSRPFRRRAAIVPVGLALGALVLAGCSSGGGSATGTTTTTAGTATTSTSAAGTTSTTAALLTAGQQGTAAQVPWSQVGKGWVLASWAATAPTATPQSGPAETLLLVDPQGGRYVLGKAPQGGRLSAWSGDGTHAIFSAGVSTTKVTVMTVKTGATKAITIGAQPGYDGVRFSRPDGLALLAGGPPVTRLGLDGSAQLTFPAAPATAGPGAKETGGSDGGWAETPSGGNVAVQASGGVDIIANSGTFTRFIPSTTGQTACILIKWWTATSLLLTCGTQLVAQPMTGGSPTQITAAATQETFLNAWALTGGTIAEAGACGTTWLNTVSTNGSVTRLNVPNGTGSVNGIAPTGANLLVLATPGCDHTGSTSPPKDVLEWYDPQTNQATALLGTGTAAGGWVDSAELFGDPTG